MWLSSVFFGQWKENNMHGCGKKYYPGGAVEEGEWVEDDFVGDFTACNATESEVRRRPLPRKGYFTMYASVGL